MSDVLGPAQLGVIVNLDDPLSVAIGKYYVNKRHIPEKNVVRLRFDSQRDAIAAAQFAVLKKTVDTRMQPDVQAYAITWARPYRVGCMSVTSAFTFGLDQKFCASGCRPTAGNPLFNTSTHRPFDDLHLRPSMLVAAVDWDHAKALIDRGIHSDGSAPDGTAYLVTTQDPQRNVRSVEYPLATRIAQHELQFNVYSGPAPEAPAKVMFYFTGAIEVRQIDRDGFLPGAIADHLTSFGGMLTDSPQMSSLRWLEAGATGSYGTVVEPCNLLGKFPNVGVLMAHYLNGETLIEAYWKSVLMPGQGVFIGEPLATPFHRH